MGENRKPRPLRRKRSYIEGPLEAKLYALHKFTQKHRLSSVLAALALYAAAFLLGAPRFHVSTNYLILLPVVTTALCYGFPGGLLAGALGLPSNLLLFHLSGHPEFAPESQLAAEASGIFLGSVLGFLSDYFLALQREVERRRETEAYLLRTLDEKNVLLRELLHRVKNNLNVMQSLIRLQASRSADPAFKDSSRTLESRIHSISLVQDYLYHHDDISGIEPREFLEGLATNIVKGFSACPVELRVFIRPGSGTFSMDVATPLGMIVNEVITNSLKHAFPSGRAAEAAINLSFYREGSDYRLVIDDNGKGCVAPPGAQRPAEGEGRGSGLGLTLVAALAAQLYGTYSFSGDSGFRFELAFPVVPPADLAPGDSAR